MQSINWNEANTFSKLTEPKLRELGFPSRSSELCDEQTYVEKKSGGFGRYDVAYKSDHGIILLIEMKKRGKPLVLSVANQALEYALGPTFDPLPPPFLLISNGDDEKWFRRIRNKDKTYKYTPCDKVYWRNALKEESSGELVEELSLAQTIKLLQRTRKIIFEDLKQNFFPKGFSFKKNNLKHRRISFEKILNTRKSFVDPTLKEKEEREAIEAVVSSISLSLTLKVLFLKILSDLSENQIRYNIRGEISRLSEKYPDILKAEPYDVLDFSSKCEEALYELLIQIRITQALVFEVKENPIGAIFDGLVKSEEQDIQVKSLGNVYTPPAIVEAMVDKASKALGSWKNKKVVEPSCGSGHFVRKVYSKMLKAYTSSKGNSHSFIAAHRKVLNSILAVDIDPFAIQTTQLGMFLELKIFPSVWKKLGNSKNFGSRNIVCGDYLQGKYASSVKRFKPDLIIGNPPYGVSVTNEVQKLYKLESKDSYGYFISKGLKDLKENGHLIYVVSSTFLTNKSHTPLRKDIFETGTPASFYILNRKAFSRDVFCCLAHLEKRKIKDPTSSFYAFQYYDGWAVHPSEEMYSEALRYWAKGAEIPEKMRKNIGYYKVPVRYCASRVVLPSPKEIDAFKSSSLISEGAKALPRKLLNHSLKKSKKEDSFVEKQAEFQYTLGGGLPKLLLYCSDLQFPQYKLVEETSNFPFLGNIDSLRIPTHKKVNVVKLWQIASALSGMQTSDDEYFLRKTKGVIPNARRKYVKDVDARLTISPSKLNSLTEDEKKNGIDVVDPQRTKHFVPFDTGGESDTAAGELRLFSSKVDYWIDWSKESVKELQRRQAFPASKSGKAYMRNSEYYFKQGIAGTITGLYAPSYYKSFGGIFGQKANLIVPVSEEIVDFLTVVLCSTLMRYLGKNFISNSVDFSTDNFRHLPIAIPNEAEIKRAEKICKRINNLILKGNGVPYSKISSIVDPYVFKLYGISAEDQKEIMTWFHRRYHLLGKKARQKNSTNQSSTKGRKKAG